jgi:hypothetical protein
MRHKRKPQKSLVNFETWVNSLISETKSPYQSEKIYNFVLFKNFLHNLWPGVGQAWKSSFCAVVQWQRGLRLHFSVVTEHWRKSKMKIYILIKNVCHTTVSTNVRHKV